MKKSFLNYYFEEVLKEKYKLTLQFDHLVWK